VLIAFAKEGVTADKRELIDGWDGSALGTSLNSDVYTVSDFSECSDTSYNSQGDEVLGSGTTESSASGAFGLQGRCGVDIASFAPWEKRYVKLFATNSHGSVFSDTFVVARVPSGMVFVAADDWPDEVKHRLAAEYGESYSAPFDFAIDKWEATASGTVSNCTSYDMPCSGGIGGGYLQSNAGVPLASRNWYTFKHGCDARTGVLHAANPAWVGNALAAEHDSGRRVHLATGVEWMVGAFGTPDTIGPQFCSTHSTFWNPGTPGDQAQTGANSMQSCMSRYGVRNMIGNVWEWTNDLADSGYMLNYWTTGGGGVDVGLPGSWNVAQGFITSWDFDKGFPLSSGVQASSLHQSDHFWENLDALSTYGPEARAARRGGRWSHGAQAGRFALDLSTAPTITLTGFGGRCALAAP
jgi:hypothetical protein